jgi:hypothetical protein
MKTIILEKLTKNNQNPDAIAIYAKSSMTDPVTGVKTDGLHTIVGFFTVEELNDLIQKIQETISN